MSGGSLIGKSLTLGIKFLQCKTKQQALFPVCVIVSVAFSCFYLPSAKKELRFLAARWQACSVHRYD